MIVKYRIIKFYILNFKLVMGRVLGSLQDNGPQTLHTVSLNL